MPEDIRLCTHGGTYVQKPEACTHCCHCRESVFDALIEEIQSPSEGMPLRNLAVDTLASELFDLGAQPETRAKNRAALYALSEQLEKAQRKRAKTEKAQAEAAAAKAEVPEQRQQQQPTAKVSKAAKKAAGGSWEHRWCSVTYWQVIVVSDLVPLVPQLSSIFHACFIAFLAST